VEGFDSQCNGFMTLGPLRHSLTHQPTAHCLFEPVIQSGNHVPGCASEARLPEVSEGRPARRGAGKTLAGGDPLFREMHTDDSG